MSNFSKYQPPTIVKMQSAYHSKLGIDGESQRVRTEIDGTPIETLVNDFGSPLFVFSESTVRNGFRRATEAFRRYYPNVKFAWSYKTNYLKGICAIFHQEGAIAEVVSGFEYEKARALGIPGKDIIFNGPFKSFDSLCRAAREGAMINIDNLSEIEPLERAADQVGRKINVGIRINMNCGVNPPWSRFGFNLESGLALDGIKRISLGKKLELVGLHSHMGTFILDVNFFKTAAHKMCALLKEIESSFSFKISHLDLGGGFPSLSHLIGVYQPPDVTVPPVEEFAKAICQTLKAQLPPGRTPILFVESGRHLIDEAGYLITSVVAQKLLPNGQRSYVLDAGVNLLYTSRWYRYNFELDRELQGPVEPATLHGPLCMNIDIVSEHHVLPPMPCGTRLILSPVGAYNITQSMQFIQYRPAVVLIRTDGKVELLKRRETLDSVEFDEQLPSHLEFAKKEAA